MINVNVTEQLNAIQRMFLPAPSISEAMQKNACCFWESQDRILDAMQTFAKGWFERRHIGARAAFETAEHMCKAETPVVLLCEYQEWTSGVFQRVMADGLACQEKFLILTGTLAQPLAPVDSGRETEPSHAKARPAVRSKAA